MKTVGQVMAPRALAVPPEASIGLLLSLLLEARTLVVRDRDDGALGVITDVDLMELDDTVDLPPDILHPSRFGAVRRARPDLRARDLIGAEPPGTIDRNAPLREAAARMLRKGLRRLIVLGPNGQIVGRIARTDVLRARGPERTLAAERPAGVVAHFPTRAG